MSAIIHPFLFGLVALFALFFKLPGVPELFGIVGCKSCTASTPYIPLFAAGYFAAFTACTLCFRSLPSNALKVAGVLWAVLLAVVLTFLSPVWCLICLIAHACHVCMWLVWKPTGKKKEPFIGMRLSIVGVAAVSMMALFSTLNFTFLVYGLQVKAPGKSLVKKGAFVKEFALENGFSSDDLSDYAGVVLHFVSSHCAYCKEQIPQLDLIAQDFEEGFRFINVGPELLDVESLGPHLEWAEDTELASLFGVAGYPTLVVIDSEGKVRHAAAGSSGNFAEKLRGELQQLR